MVVLQAYGWYLVILIVAGYWLTNKGIEALDAYQHRKSQREATDPARVAALQAQEIAVRQQQIAYWKEETKRLDAERKKKQEESAAMLADAKLDRSSSGDHHRPSGAMRFKKRPGKGG
jgi:uncharacterized small protein (DUF1192 family)